MVFKIFDETNRGISSSTILIRKNTRRLWSSRSNEKIMPHTAKAGNATLCQRIHVLDRPSKNAAGINQNNSFDDISEIG